MDVLPRRIIVRYPCAAVQLVVERIDCWRLRGEGEVIPQLDIVIELTQLVGVTLADLGRRQRLAVDMEAAEMVGRAAAGLRVTADPEAHVGGLDLPDVLHAGPFHAVYIERQRSAVLAVVDSRHLEPAALARIGDFRLAGEDGLPLVIRILDEEVELGGVDAQDDRIVAPTANDAEVTVTFMFIVGAYLGLKRKALVAAGDIVEVACLVVAFAILLRHLEVAVERAVVAVGHHVGRFERADIDVQPVLAVVGDDERWVADIPDIYIVDDGGNGTGLRPDPADGQGKGRMSDAGLLFHAVVDEFSDGVRDMPAVDIQPGRLLPYNESQIDLLTDRKLVIEIVIVKLTGKAELPVLHDTDIVRSVGRIGLEQDIARLRRRGERDIKGQFIPVSYLVKRRFGIAAAVFKQK